MNKILYLALLFLIIPSLYAQNEVRQVKNNLDKVEEEIWSLEGDYISYFREAKHKEILSLCHSKGLVWPASELQPIGKEEAIIFLEEKYPTPSKLIFKIIQKGIRVIGNVVITHYLLITSWIDEEGTEQKSESRITHTWIKEDSQWKILGGMSSSK